MSKDEEFQKLLYNQHSYSFHKVEGLPAILREQLVTQDEIAVGDKVELFCLPNGKYFISKAAVASNHAFTVGKITTAHIYFDDDITLKEN